MARINTVVNNLGILTFHSSFNEGAIWQAYCLATSLQENLPSYCVEVIDHRYQGKMELCGPPKNSRTQALDQFINKRLPLSQQQFVEDDHKQAYEYIRNNCQCLVVGSDQVWKTHYVLGRKLLGFANIQNFAMCPAFPNVYWPDETINIPKVAYAVSIGESDWGGIFRLHRNKMRRILSNFSLLGIRDEMTRDFLRWLDPVIASKAEWVPDPTFSLDSLGIVDKKSLRDKLEQYGVDFSRPRLGIVAYDETVTNDVTEQVKKMGFQVIALSISNTAADVRLFEKGFTPLEWASIYGFFDLCLTSKMHGAIACILNNTPFVGLGFYENQVSGNSKIKDLMQSFNLERFYYSPRSATGKQLRDMCDAVITGSWPSEETIKNRRLFQRRSKEFIAKIKNLLLL